MSSRRSIAWLLFLVALAAGAHVLLTIRGEQGVVAARRNVLVDGADAATLVELARTGMPAVVAVRSDRWRIVAPFAASVERSTLLRLLDALAFAPVTDALTESELRLLGRNRADFGLAPAPLRISVRQGLRETSVSFGDLTPARDGVYVWRTDPKGVCVIPTNVFAALDLTVDALRRRELLTESDEPTVTLDVRRPKGKFVRVARAENGLWQIVEPRASPASATRVAALLEGVSAARATRFLWPVAGTAATSEPPVSLLAGYGLDSESAVTVTLKDSGGTSRYVSFGKAADPGTVYALVQNGAAVATVDAKLFARILSEADSFVDLRLFPYEEADVTTLTIADGETVYLVARSGKDEWRIDSPVAAPADQDAVRSLLKNVLSLRTTERDLKGLKVSVSTNSEPIAVARDALLVQNRLEALRSKTVLKLPSDQIRRISVTSGDGSVQAAVWDAEKCSWLLAKPDGGTLDGLALAGVLAALDPLQAESVARLRVVASELGNYGLEKPRVTIALDPTREGAVRRNVLIGSARPGGGAYATVGATDAVFVLSEKVVRALTASFATKPPASR